MKVRWWKYVVTVAVFSAMIFLEGQTVKADGDVLTIGVQDNSATLDPAKAYETMSMSIVPLSYEQLVTFEGDDLTNPVPALAESWTLADDGRTWTFVLRKGAVFANGNPVNADAVVFSLQRLIDLGSDPSWLLTQFGVTKEMITKVDDMTVRIVLEQQYAPTMVLSCLASSPMSILDPVEVLSHEQDGDLGSAWLEKHSAGSGPYQFKDMNKQEQHVLQANELYWRGTPRWSELRLKHIPDSFEQAALLEQGDIDIAWNLGPNEKLSLSDKPEIQVLDAQWVKIHWIGMNVTYEPFTKPEVRQAVRAAINYDQLCQGILQGAAEPVQSFLAPGMLGYSSAVERYNPEQARELLAEAGYPDGFAVELNSMNFSPWADVAMHVKHDLEAVGIHVTVNLLEPKEHAKRVTSHQFQMALWGWLFDYPDPNANASPFAHSDSTEGEATVKLAAWWTRYVNKETSEMVEQAVKELNTEKRATLYQQIEQIIMDDGPFAFLFVPIRSYGIRSELSEMVVNQRFVVQDLPVLKHFEGK